MALLKFPRTLWGIKRMIRFHENAIKTNDGIIVHLKNHRDDLLNGKLSSSAGSADFDKKLGALVSLMGVGVGGSYVAQNFHKDPSLVVAGAALAGVFLAAGPSLSSTQSENYAERVLWGYLRKLPESKRPDAFDQHVDFLRAQNKVHGLYASALKSHLEVRGERAL